MNQLFMCSFCKYVCGNCAQNYIQATSGQSLEVLEDHRLQADQGDQEDPVKSKGLWVMHKTASI